MVIKSVIIKNFRSIQSFNHKAHELNIFVGQNDEGKSNILRALDLFFNHDKREGYEIDWNRDYSSFAPSRKGKADEIVIVVEIIPPASFSSKTSVMWRKVWRREGLYREEIKLSDGSELPPRSKITSFVRSIRFDYVPAIKGKEYFQSLMSKLHDMLEATVEGQVRRASGSFTDTINENTTVILEEIQKRLDLKTTIQLPSNLRQLFAQLEFTSISGEKPFALEQRGDGVKVRHIPIVLRWLAEQANHLSAPGRPKTVTIWGYEEPENNLELKRCFELAREFVAGAGEIQTFVTTHSPAFYSVFRENGSDNVGLFLVEKSGVEATTDVRLLAGGDLDTLDTSMGLLSLLAPHFKEAEKKIRSLQSAYKQLTNTSIPTIFCEGPSDKVVFEKTLQLFFPDEAAKVSVRCSTHHGGGHTWVSDQMISWSYGRPTANAIGVFDLDEDAKKSMIATRQIIKPTTSGKKVYDVLLTKSEDIKACHIRHIIVPCALEELFPKEVWDFAESSGWLEERTNLIALYNFKQTDISFDEYLSKALPETHLFRIATKKVKRDHKEALANYICNFEDEGKLKAALSAFEAPMKDCLKKLGLA